MKVVDGVGQGEGVETLEWECGERWKALMSCRTRRLRVGAAAAAEARYWLAAGSYQSCCDGAAARASLFGLVFRSRGGVCRRGCEARAAEQWLFAERRLTA